MSATAVPASACLSATPICSSVNPFLGILRTSFPGASLPEKLRWDWIRIGGQDHSQERKEETDEEEPLHGGADPSGAQAARGWRLDQGAVPAAGDRHRDALQLEAQVRWHGGERGQALAGA